MRILVVVFFLSAILLPRPAAAFVVDSTADASDAIPGDGVCAASDGTCTLRAAIEEANALPGVDAVQLPAATYRRTVASALEVMGDLDVSCPDGVATIDAVGLGRVLHVASGASLGVHDVVIRGGTSAGAPGGGGILNEGNVVLAGVRLVVNDGDVAAGIHNTPAAFMRITRSLIAFNGPGAAILNEGSLAVDRSTIERNTGLGIENHGTTDLSLVTIGDNLGGIASYAVDATVPRMTADRCSLVFNGKRGALENVGTAVLRRSTISGNQGARASAVLTSGGGTLELENVTIADNGSLDTPAAALDGDGTAVVRVRNTIIAGNASSSGDPDCRLTVTSLGANLMSCSLDAPDPTTIVGDPRLAPLKEWRFLFPDLANERTFAHGLLPGSPAIDAGSCEPSTDQRGVDRPQGRQCDIGAVEVAPLCQNGVGIAGARVRIRQSAGGGGTSTIKVTGALAFPATASPVLDPLTDGLQLRVERVDGADAALVERTELTEPLFGVRQGCGGWRAVRPGTRFGWRSSATGGTLCVPGEVGKLVVSLDDQRGKARGIALKAQANLPQVSPGAAVRVTVVLGADPLGGSTAGATGACAVQDLVCTSDGTQTRFDCR